MQNRTGGVLFSASLDKNATRSLIAASVVVIFDLPLEHLVDGLAMIGGWPGNHHATSEFARDIHVRRPWRTQPIMALQSWRRVWYRQRTAISSAIFAKGYDFLD